MVQTGQHCDRLVWPWSTPALTPTCTMMLPRYEVRGQEQVPSLGAATQWIKGESETKTLIATTVETHGHAREGCEGEADEHLPRATPGGPPQEIHKSKIRRRGKRTHPFRKDRSHA